MDQMNKIFKIRYGKMHIFVKMQLNIDSVCFKFKITK